MITGMKTCIKPVNEFLEWKLSNRNSMKSNLKNDLAFFNFLREWGHKLLEHYLRHQTKFGNRVL